jgi:lipoyl(octanoyl) transferase
VTPDGPLPRKIGALGLRIERGVTYHGIALNISVDLADFALIDPCGMPGLTSASIASELGRRAEVPSTESVARAAAIFAPAFARRLGTTCEGALPPNADPAAGRASAELAAAAPAVAAAVPA